MHPFFAVDEKSLHSPFKAGLPDFFSTLYQNGENIPKDQQLYQMAIKYTK
jgi:hypothetical protein